MAYCMNTTTKFSGKLLLPEEPEGTNTEKMLQMNFKLKPENGKREDYKATSDRFEKFVHVLFAQYRCKAYIGRGW